MDFSCVYFTISAFSAGKQMDKMCHLPYKKGIRSTLMAADAFILRIFSECA